MPTGPTPLPPDPYDVAALTWLPYVAWGAVVATFPVGLIAIWITESPTVAVGSAAATLVIGFFAMIIAGLWPCPFCGSPFQYNVRDRAFFSYRGMVVPGLKQCVNCDRSIETPEGALRDQEQPSEDQNRER